MKRKDMDYILEEIGKQVQEESYEEVHEFSREYEEKKQKLLKEAANMDKRKRNFRRPVAAAAAVVLVAGLSLTAYAAVRMIQARVTSNEKEDTVNIAVDRLENDYIPPIEISLGYLPEGYEKWDDDKYSMNGEWGASGISVADVGYCQGYTEPDISDYEELQIGNAKAVLLHREGAEYPWNIYLFYEEDGHVVEVWGCDALSKEEIVKVCENLNYKEVPDQDPNHSYQAFSWNEAEEVEDSDLAEEDILSEQIMEMGESFPGYTPEFAETDQLTYCVKDIRITDTVQTELLSTDTTTDYQQVMSCIKEDGTLVPYTRTVSEWIDQAYTEREIGTTEMKNVEVTVQVQNDLDTDLTDVNMQPVWKNLTKEEDGTWSQDNTIPGYEEDENYRGNNFYGISYDNMPYYFDSSAFLQSTHFYNMTIAAGETKEVHLWFAIPADQIDTAYLCFGREYIPVMK